MTDTDAALAARLAREAGALLLALRESPETAGAGGLGAAGDRAAHEFLLAELTRHRPDDDVLSEEGADNQRRLQADRVWIVDPLDGTREFAENRSDWAVHVALWERDDTGGRLVAGAVALPADGTVLSSENPPAVPEQGERPRRIAVSRTRAPEFARAAASELSAELVPMGSAGYKVASVVLGATDAYIHAGGQYEWDSAAPVAVALAAGLSASRLDGSPLRYNNADPYLPDLLVARPELADVLLAACSDAASDLVTVDPRSQR
ncbi:3'(2'),5'-bisphosphate nucleotidase CysQ [Phytoactinopolyspora limicola]|uniref:3'(2'),5'-bisphosphate nucleotidase CysQ n=1 Tax=Phytoactinopolyspora limicola TaxID=2715536 RepID=UPI001FE42DB0|nr:3'(2'),5'-bisphosphate nucleotidase CysQ [Phytoactinopolyspora limicola]